MLPTEPLWRPDEAAAFLKVAPKTLHRWKQQGRVPFIRIGRTIRYNPEALRALVLASSTTAVPAAGGGSSTPGVDLQALTPREQ